MMSLPSVASLSVITTTAVPPQLATAADKVSTRVTPAAVTAPVASQSVADNGAGKGLSTIPAQQGQTPFSAAENPLAQVVAQEQGGDVSFSHFAPALQYNTLVGYGFVKYKPSDAGVPTGRGSSTSQEVLTNRPMHTAPEYQAYQSTQLRNQSELDVPASSPVIVAG